MAGAGGSEITVAVMGMTGAGKSSFIKKLTGNEDIVVGDGLESGTYSSKSSATYSISSSVYINSSGAWPTLTGVIYGKPIHICRDADSY
jgi:putative ribosome biogenesis GTPase RsgA